MLVAEAKFDNPFPKTIELKTEIINDDNSADVVNVMVSLQFNTALYLEDRGVPYYYLAVHAASIDVRPRGFEVLEKTKHGKLVIGGEDYLADEEIEQSSERKVGGSAKAGLSELSVSGEGSLSAGQKLRTQRQVRHRHIPVRSAGADSWEVTHARGEELVGYFLNYDQLCQCKARWDGNHREIVVEIRVKARDIVVGFEEETNWLARLSGDDTGSKIANIVIAKRLHDMSSSDRYMGEIIMARATHPDDI